MNNTQPFMPEPDSSTAAAAGPLGSPRNFVLASIGLLSLMADQITALMERSVQRGNDVVERAQAEAGRRHAAPRANDERQAELPHSALPTHRDFEVLLQRVTELEQQIDQIAAQRAAGQ
jgi:hypothetical protein